MIPENMTPGEAFEVLRKKHGNHSAAARALCINISYYRDIRHGRAKRTGRMKELLLMKATDDTEDQSTGEASA